MLTYIKKDIVEKVAAKTDMDPKDAAGVVNAIFETLREMMCQGEPECRIEVRNFGVFEVKRTAAKPKARNPKKPHLIIYIPPRLKTHFRPGILLKSYLRQPLED